MKKKSLIIIVGLMSIALTGLIMVQIYWIKNAIDLESKLFDYNVSKALNSVVSDISKNESAEYVVHKLSDPQSTAMVYLDSDSSAKKEYSLKKEGVWVSNYNIESDNSAYSISFEKHADSDSSLLVVEQITTDNKGKSRIETKKIISSNKLDSLKFKKSVFVNEVVDNLIFVRNTKKIENRISKKNLARFIRGNLENNGVSADFIFGIKSEKRDSILFVNDDDQSEDLKNTTYRAKLFPEELLTAPDLLLLYFPGRTGYLLRSTSEMLILSAIFILTIIFLYYKTVRLLISQKRIADIKSDLINNITHEFKTPIATISLASEALREDDFITNKNSIDKYALIIREENHRLQKMVDSLLNSAFWANGNPELEKTEINIHSIISELVEKSRLRLNPDKDKIDVEFNAEKYSVNGDVFHITNLMDNVIDNAIKYSDNSVTITIKTKSDENGITILIKDEGIGIEKHQIKKIFNEFYRVQKGDIQNTRGYGIGLSYAKKIVKAHNGKISATSKPGTGSEFIIYLPYG